MRKMQISNNEYAAIGIGTLIVFIAMVLVAGIAASVLVSTSDVLEMQALKSGQQTINEVASGINVLGVEGYNSSGQIIRMSVELMARSGSPEIDLSQTVMEISDSSVKYVLEYQNTIFTDSNETSGNIYTSSFYPTSSPTTTFGIIVLLDADDSCNSNNPVINLGDHVLITIGNVFSGLSPRSDVFGMVISEDGAPGIIGFTTPSSYTNSIIPLQ